MGRARRKAPQGMRTRRRILKARLRAATASGDRAEAERLAEVLKRLEAQRVLRFGPATEPENRGPGRTSDGPAPAGVPWIG